MPGIIVNTSYPFSYLILKAAIPTLQMKNWGSGSINGFPKVTPVAGGRSWVGNKSDSKDFFSCDNLLPIRLEPAASDSSSGIFPNLFSVKSLGEQCAWIFLIFHSACSSGEQSEGLLPSIPRRVVPKGKTREKNLFLLYLPHLQCPFPSGSAAMEKLATFL